MTGRPFRSRSHRPPSLNLSFSRDSSPSGSSRASSRNSRKSSSPEPDSEEDMGMSIRRRATTKNASRARPMSVCPGSGLPAPYYPQRPSLRDVLSNNAPPPYTFSAFTAYLSQNHCLETLEFTMDAERYRNHFDAMARSGAPLSETNPEGCKHVCGLWQRLLDAYIVPNGPREVNIPCNVRDRILSYPRDRTPPPPDALNPAVEIVNELMEESVLMPFLTECQSASCHEPPPLPPWDVAQSDENLYMRGSLDERLLNRRRRDPSPPMPADYQPVSQSYSPGDPRPQRRVGPFSPNLGWHRHSTHMAPQSWASSSAGSGGSLIDDSGTSTTSSAGTPMTPPTTPPSSDLSMPSREGSDLGSSRGGTSPKEEKAWKKITTGMGRGLVWGKKKRSGVFNESGLF